MRPFGLSLVAALSLHVAVVLVARALPPMALLRPTDQRELRLIEVELPTALSVVETPPPPPTPDQPEAPRPSEPDRAPDPRVAARTAPAPGAAAAPEGPATAAPEASAAPAPSQKPTQFDELPDERKGGVLGLPGGPGGPALWAVPGVLPTGVAAAAPAPTVAPAPRPVDKNIGDKVLGDAMAARDKDLGLNLPAAGTIATAVRSQLQGSEIPAGSRGSLEFRIGPNGQLLGARVVTMVGGSAAMWERAAKAAAAQAAGLAMTGAYAKGAIVTIDVNVTDQAPSGSKGGFTGTGAAFDVSNIGAHSTRHVRTGIRVVAIR